MSISFGGLATGLDTNSIISQLVALERQPINRLEADRTWQQARLEAFTSFDGTLKGMYNAAKDLTADTALTSKKVTLSSSEYFSATADATAFNGSYQIEVVAMAQAQKDVSQGYSDPASLDFGTGNLSLTVGSNSPVSITIDSSNNSLNGIRDAINDADAGVKAAIINDGTGTPYRLIIAGTDVGTSFTLDSSGLTGGTNAAPAMTSTQSSQQAHLRVDNLDIYADSNTLTEAIPGVTLTLNSASVGVESKLSVTTDEGAIKSKIEAFASTYSGIMAFVNKQSKTATSNGGVLGGDSGLNSIKRHLQNLLTTQNQNTGQFSSLAEIGFATQKDGTLVVDSSKLADAISQNLTDVQALLQGEDGVEGIAETFQNYLETITDNSTGMLKGRRDSITKSLERIDDNILTTEKRVAKRQQTLQAQFNALEQLMSGLNAQSSYLTQQMDVLNNLWSQK